MLDEFFVGLSSSEHVELIRMGYFSVALLAVFAFLYYWVRALVTALGGAWRLHKSGKSVFEFNKFSNPDTQRFLGFWIKGFLVWLLAGWPLVLVSSGLVSEEAMNAFFGYDAIHTGTSS